MKVKLTKNIVHSPDGIGTGKHHKAGAVIEVDDKLGTSLIKRELAEESTEGEPSRRKKKSDEGNGPSAGDQT